MISTAKLQKTILSDKYNLMIFKNCRHGDAYLVGGYVRDKLRGIHSRDRDYIIRCDIMHIAEKIKENIRGTIITFKKGETVRIATKDGLTFDFSTPRGSLKEDLSKRDFTINAIAWSPNEGIIDPFNGLDDLQKKKVSIIRKENLLDDPLRMLRAYRFAAEINGFVGKNTRQFIKLFSNNIKEITSERITLELFNLLNSDQSAKYLRKALCDGLLGKILFFNYKKLERNIKGISLFETRTFHKLPLTIKVKLKEIISQNLTHKGLLCLALLMEDGLKNYNLLLKIRMSNKINKRLKVISRYKNEKVTKDTLFDLFIKAEDISIDILTLKNRPDYIKEYKRFSKIMNKGVISSEEVMYQSGIKSGKTLGDIIEKIKRAQYEGRVKNKNSAIKLIKKNKENI